MRIAILGESKGDEAILRVFVDAILGHETVPVHPPPRHGGGYGPMVKAILAVVRSCYYDTPADGLIIIGDSNSSPIHDAKADSQVVCDPKCRLCELRQQVQRTKDGLSPLADRGPFNVGLGLAVPAIEAWLRCGRDPNVTEAAWIEAQGSGSQPFTRISLKGDVYGTTRVTLQHELTIGVREAQRVAGDLASLEKRFPVGFGALTAAIRSWRT